MAQVCHLPGMALARHVEVVAGAGHQLPVEQPERLVSLVTGFVEALS